LKSKAPSSETGIKIIAQNKKAFHEYFILEKLEVGISLAGSELRPCREGRVNLKDSYAEVENGQMWLMSAHIGSNPFSNRNDHQPERKRRLLAHKKEILKLGHKVEASGNSLVPLKIYFKNGKVKVEIALVKGKRQYDKRETLAKKDLKREMDREMSGRN
jgi:SsrA-binding protein